MAKRTPGIVMPTGKLTPTQLAHRLAIRHASGRFEPNDRAREAQGRRRGSRKATRRRDIAAGW